MKCKLDGIKREINPLETKNLLYIKILMFYLRKHYLSLLYLFQVTSLYLSKY